MTPTFDDGRPDSSRAARDALLAARHAIAATVEARRTPARAPVDRSLPDTTFHLSYLATAVSTSRPALFLDYLAWAKVVLVRRGYPESALAEQLADFRDALVAHLPVALAGRILTTFDDAVAQLASLPLDVPTLLRPDRDHRALAEQYLAALLAADRGRARTLILEANAAGVGVRALYSDVFGPVLAELGRLWQLDRITVAQEHYCSAATQLIMSLLYPQIFSGTRTGLTFVGTCVSGDLHEFGMRMVSDFFELEGWDTYYLGASCPNASVVRTAIEQDAAVLGISATMPWHVDGVASLIREMRANPRTQNVKIMVGGYPFNVVPDLWQVIGADGFARSATEAISVGSDLAKRGRSSTTGLA